MITAMKKILLLAAAAIMAAGAMQAKTADEVRIYLNPGHGSWGPNDRPMATIPYPMTPETGRPDTCGFYESNTNLWKVLQMGVTLERMGVKKENIMYSRVKNGPYPYVSGAADAEIYNRSLSEIAREVDANNMDMFVSMHSNAASEGTSTNYPLYLYRGQDKSANYEHNEGSYEMCEAGWNARYMNEIDPQSHYSRTNTNIRGDWNFYGEGNTITSTTAKGTFRGYLGALRHGTPGFLVEGYFHTYQPARHRALNQDYCRQEGMREARGIGAYFGFTPESVGCIMGTVKDLHEKIVHNLYKYSPGTDDQYLPLNGATVTLKKNGTEVATYTVDNNYNGVFVFEDLEPGDYTISAACAGYKPIFEEAAVTVTANATSYALLHLENENFVPEEVVYYNYPDPEQPVYLGLGDTYNFTCDGGTTYEMEGAIKRAITRGDSTLILTEGESVPHIYLINNKTKTLIKELSMNGLPAAEPNNLGFYSRLGDIAFTADGQLVGVNYVRCQYDAARVDEGYTRGTVRFVKWANLDADPVEWLTTQSSANWLRADMGKTLAVSGPAKECEILITGITSGASRAVRFLVLNVNDNEIVATHFTEKSTTGVFTEPKQGVDVQLNVSPLDDHQYVLNGSLCAPLEFIPAGTDNTDSQVIGTLDTDVIGAASKGLAFFKYAKHALVAAPVVTDSKFAGVALYDITNGLGNAIHITTVGTTLDEPLTGTFNAAGASVDGEDMNLFLIADNKMYRFYTSGVEQPIFRGNYAYELRTEETDDTFTFKFKTTEDVEDVTIVLTPVEGGDPIVVPVGNAMATGNEIIVNKNDYPENDYNWEVVVPNGAVPTINKIFKYAPEGNGSYCVRGLAIDQSPESPYFQNIYLGNPYGTKGIYEVNPDLTVANPGAPYLTNSWNSSTSSPFRMGVNPNNGFLYMADWSDPNGGIFVMDPANTDVCTPFFLGTRSNSGLIKNAQGTSIGGSSTCAAFLGMGEDTKLISFQEDLNQVPAIYKIGTSNSTDQAPDKIFTKASGKLINTNVEATVLEDGMFLSQYRSSGNNDTNVPAFIYVDYEDNILFNSGTISELDGCYASGFAINSDKSLVAVATAKPYIAIFAVEWNDNVPSFTHLYTIETYTGTGCIINQMKFDHADNLFVADAKYGAFAITIPRPAQDVVTPAAKAHVFSNKTTSISDTNANKTVQAVKYYNTLGVASDAPFDGINIVVTTYTDGTKSSVKVIK